MVCHEGKEVAIVGEDDHSRRPLSRLVRIERFLSARRFRVLSDFLALSFFLIVVIGPTIYVFFTVLDWNTIHTWVFADPFTGNTRWLMMLRALTVSFEIAGVATIVDIIIGLPMALILARYQFRYKKFVDTLVDLPMAVPTSALGFSLFLFWGTKEGLAGLLGMDRGLLSRGPLMVILAHVAFTYPYIVRSLKAIIIGIDETYEDAARTLGAPPITVFRSITFPLMTGGLLSGATLAFTRSLGETGATIILSGVYSTAPVLIVSWRQMLQIPPTAFLSVILVAIAIILTTIVRIVMRIQGGTLGRVWPSVERRLSRPSMRVARDTFVVVSFALIVLVPSVFIIDYMAGRLTGSPYTGRAESGVIYQVFLAPDQKWDALLDALVTSLRISVLATAINMAAGLPMAFAMIRRRWGMVKGILDFMIDVPLSVPTAALGFSFFLFWGSEGLNLIHPGFWLVAVVHIAFTYPYVVRTLMAVIEGLDPGVEEAAATLGAPPLTVFRTVTLPLLGPGMLAAAIMAFTRSLGETGATIVVMGLSRTIPVLIVDWVESLALPAASFACVILIVISYCLLLALRYLLGWE